MKTTIVCGLLGAGKTTFIRQLVGNAQEKTVVLVNDFGEAGIDGEIFSAEGIESVELPSGCVCCTLKFDLVTTIEKIIRNLSPEHLVIEPSGVASPSGVLETLDLLGIGQVMVVGIVDAAEFVELHESQMYGSFFEDQIVNSDIILVNKADLAGEDQVRGAVALAEKINPRAIVFPAVNAAVSLSLPEVSRMERTLSGHPPGFHFETLSLRMSDEKDFIFYENFFEDMGQGVYGDVVRAKALVQTDRGPYRFDLSHGGIDKSRFPKEIADSRLVLIGERLKKDILLLLSKA